MIKEHVVKVPFQNLKYIHHISDIQIRNLKRHKEYEEVFIRLYEKVKENKDNAVVYIGGDIAHSKTEMSPELVDQLSRFLKNLSNICPTIIIAGNHDCNLNNRSRLDVLTPIVNNLKHPNLHYLKDSGVYKCADVSFVVWDCWSEEKDYIISKNVEGNTKIVLFHGTVDKAQTDLGFRLPSDVHINKFKGYDLGLLGDIHKRQHLNEEKTIAYCGSLIQQNHGEDIGKGYLLWDVLSRKSKYIEIQNDYGYYTLDINNGVVPDVYNMPKKARLRVRVCNTDAAKLKKCLAIIHKKYKIESITVIRTDGFEIDRMGAKKRIDVGDVTNPDYQYELIEEYLTRNYFVDEKTLLKIKKINDDLNSLIPEEDISRNVNWKLKKFEFNNMFSYGKGNVVDFTKLNGIVGLFAPNASGKSSLLDALSFCLFDTTSRTFKAENVMNNKRKSFDCKVNFEIGNMNYFIERTAKKMNSGHVKVNVDFWLVDDTGEKISLNGDQRRTTNFNIRKVVGTYEDFILTTLSLQNNSTVFIDKTQKERKELLAQFMGIGIFDKLYTLAHENVFEVSALLKDFKKTDYGKQLSDIQKKIESLDKEYRVLVDEKKDYVLEEKQLSMDILDLTKKLKPIDKSVVNINELKEKKIQNKNKLESINIKLGEIKIQAEKRKIKETELRNKISEYTERNINKQYLDLQNYEREKNDLNNDIEKLKINVSHKKDKKKLVDLIDHLEKDHNPNCQFCAENEILLEARETEKALEKDALLARKYLSKRSDLNTIIINNRHIRDKKEDFDTSLSALQSVSINQNKLISEQTLLVEKKKNFISQILVMEEKITKYYTQEKDIFYNKEIEEDIEDLKGTIEDLSSLLQKLEDQINYASGQIKIEETNKKNIIDTINRVEKLENKFEAYQSYLNAIKRDGIPYELIMKALPTVEGEVNNILSQLVEFGIILDMDGKNINCRIVYGDNVWPLELSSGMERFISSLAIRVGLINVSNLPRSNFLAIDEGWGTMDSDNLNSVDNLFQYLKSQFQFTLIVSHIDSMRDAVDTLVEITKIKDYSNIKYV